MVPQEEPIILPCPHIPEWYLIEYSRPNQTHFVATEGEPDNAEFDMYRHPHQLVESEPFHQDFDIYSFRFFLVMIALWKKIEDIAKTFNVTVSTTREAVVLILFQIRSIGRD